MSTDLFQCRSHVAPCQHIRQYPRATSTRQEELLQSHVKQYIPRDNLKPRNGDITIVAAHALGYPKELYEPLFDELLKRLHKSNNGVRIRSIWIADIATHGTSSILNEGKLGNDPSYFDWARDILLMINQFRDEMPRPLVGLAHSMGACSLVNTALFHPRLFASVILVEPALNRMHRAMNFTPIYAIATKRDRWPSRAAATAWARRNPFLNTFDPRVLGLYIQHNFRELPTLLYPDPKAQPSTAPAATSNTPATSSTKQSPPEKPVTLTITRDHDVSLFARGAYPEPKTPLSGTTPDRTQYPDISESDFRSLNSPFYRPETVLTFMQLPYLRPSCLYIYGETSTFTSASLIGRADKLSITGTAAGGSGGHAIGKVQDHVIKNTGHFCPFERPADVAEAIVPFLEHQLNIWKREERDEGWERKNVREKSMLDEQWLHFAREYLGPKSKPLRKQEHQKEKALRASKL